MWDWSILPADPAFILNALTCSQWGGWSDSGYCNKAYDSLYARQAADISKASRISLIRTGFVLSPNGSFSQMSVQTMLQLHRT